MPQTLFGSPSPLHLKFLSPKTAHFVMQIISAIFQGKMITAGFGKLSSTVIGVL
jgi:hypothetical protein